jgi:hypothetical protein
MRSFLSNMTAVLLALHTVLGCCWHHAHHCAEQSTTSVVSVSLPDGDHVNSTSHDSCGEEHQSHQECQASRCVFMVAPASERHQAATHLDMASVVSSTSFGMDFNGAGRRPAFFASNALRSPLRLHLVYQIFLI